ncbi:bifunctional DNA-formamidopyrimidine glycosylase/DNA-(apurinic or apyrimidinic site) lyase [Pelovirga terrestris]|uniref:Formamidopyrimidine-DNA glycosylase n=1 Tax=Pelovirga terrestris TaxID=2771352 RepID=A0A8J6QM05_9BACT|nr:bifunctional DNA-formamidopyrimidine glycosylase/DNA-(apurinic or apyrimidinic site) lyase [Pelovirga terrestris]MBD1400999.1 bifunctional DNA-formamidopyrimidine glycosylase/DNA-(apurinic or apyrimidinic site) lyase [Pelovirga terrestris]
MPELPEVETVCRGIAPHVIGKAIQELILRAPKLRLPLDPQLCRILPGQTIATVSRRAKYLLLETDQGGLLIHLGMTGVLRLLPAGTTENKHDHVDLIFTDGTCLRLTDPRRFGTFVYSPDKLLNHPLLKNLGPEPLSDSFSGEMLYHLSRGKAQPIKVFIMDQKVVVGVGNIYANEALFRAGIHPVRAAGRIGRQRYQRLVIAIQEVLRAAIDAGGTTISDFADSEGRPGYFRQELLVYGRRSGPCCYCGRAIHSCRIGQRSTFYCSHCQR